MIRLVIERRKLGWSQSELARRIGANPVSISRIERGKEPPYPLRSQRIADALGWEGDPAELFEDVTDDETNG
ncbi:Helix-turn-helix [Slackia heliotrinireducens]|uniref:Helix-turn-helix protein n=1 Tax=Slackia heliotrinireducens (strain ATCC 29202 / DSM 20476 / NCTC 11029 / RHS 1) TaxID=471855 RepID=C7N3C8_SLAHD|nr:helix-turn-helix transcriptional regulator [Slackia heliotrinireducens]ACV23651.1 Helix-turn-helix protein [Slackia heliotrinireducens DSM 20476]VEH03170.1 Helix-turn-helix [Slackia heliotrinireducens]